MSHPLEYSMKEGKMGIEGGVEIKFSEEGRKWRVPGLLYAGDL